MRSRLKWAGHVESMEGERLSKRLDARTLEGSRRRGRLGLRWEDCVKRCLAGVEWRMKARDRGSGDGWWRRQ